MGQGHISQKVPWNINLGRCGTESALLKMAHAVPSRQPCGGGGGGLSTKYTFKLVNKAAMKT